MFQSVYYATPPTSQPTGELAHLTPITNTHFTRNCAIQANEAFDEAVRLFLRHWIANGTAPASAEAPGTLSNFIRFVVHEEEVEAFVEQGALRSFFKHHDDALERILAEPTLATHLLRPGCDVFFEPDAYEPLLAKFERRIYNLAAHREHLEVPFRYSPASRQGADGDSVGWEDRCQDQEAREDIGYYFGTRRSDTTALNLLARPLAYEAQLAGALPVHVITEGYMTESLRAVRAATEAFQAQADNRIHCFVIHRRHAADDRHLGAALLLMDPAEPGSPRRVLFCDTLKPNGQPAWWHSFKQKVDEVFLQAPGLAVVSDRLEDAGVNLQRLHEGVPVRHQDIDCAFYSASMALALIQLAAQQPDLLLSGELADVVDQMTERMPAYFEQAGCPKDPVAVREVNVIRRWHTGRQALLLIRQGFLV